MNLHDSLSSSSRSAIVALATVISPHPRLLLGGYPGISREDLLACLSFASEIVHAETAA